MTPYIHSMLCELISQHQTFWLVCCIHLVKFLNRQPVFNCQSPPSTFISWTPKKAFYEPFAKLTFQAVCSAYVCSSCSGGFSQTRTFLPLTLSFPLSLPPSAGVWEGCSRATWEAALTPGGRRGVVGGVQPGAVVEGQDGSLGRHVWPAGPAVYLKEGLPW